MLHLKVKFGLSVLVFHHTVVCLLLTHLCAGQSELIGPPQPIVAIVGDDIILPCHLEPAMDAFTMTVEWARPDLDPRFVHVWRDGVELLIHQNPSYRGRTSLFMDKLKLGDVSLKLSKVKLSDEGRYRCFFPSLDRDSFMKLVVGSVSSPVIEITKSSSGVVLECECKGWYPEPELFWLDGEGNILSAGPPETVRGPDGLYTVSSRVTVEKTDTNSFTCRAQQLSINQTRDTQVQVPDDFFMVPCSCYVVCISIGLAVVFMCVFAVVLLVWKRRSNTSKNKLHSDDETEPTGETNTRSSHITEVNPLMQRERDREQIEAPCEARRDLDFQNEKYEEMQRKRDKWKESKGKPFKLKGHKRDLEAERQREENERKLQETLKQKEAAEQKENEYKQLLLYTNRVLNISKTELEKQCRLYSRFPGYDGAENQRALFEISKKMQTLMKEIEMKIKCNNQAQPAGLTYYGRLQNSQAEREDREASKVMDIKIAELEEELQRTGDERKHWEGECNKLMGQRRDLENQTERLKLQLEEAERQRDENEKTLGKTIKQKESVEEEINTFVSKTKWFLTNRMAELEKQQQNISNTKWISRAANQEVQFEILKEMQTLMNEFEVRLKCKNQAQPKPRYGKPQNIQTSPRPLGSCRPGHGDEDNEKLQITELDNRRNRTVENPHTQWDSPPLQSSSTVTRTAVQSDGHKWTNQRPLGIYTDGFSDVDKVKLQRTELENRNRTEENQSTPVHSPSAVTPTVVQSGGDWWTNQHHFRSSRHGSDDDYSKKLPNMKLENRNRTVENQSSPVYSPPLRSRLKVTQQSYVRNFMSYGSHVDPSSVDLKTHQPEPHYRNPQNIQTNRRPLGSNRCSFGDDDNGKLWRTRSEKIINRTPENPRTPVVSPLLRSSSTVMHTVVQPCGQTAVPSTQVHFSNTRPPGRRPRARPAYWQSVHVLHGEDE